MLKRKMPERWVSKVKVWLLGERADDVALVVGGVVGYTEAEINNGRTWELLLETLKGKLESTLDYQTSPEICEPLIQSLSVYLTKEYRDKWICRGMTKDKVDRLHGTETYFSVTNNRAESLNQVRTD